MLRCVSILEMLSFIPKVVLSCASPNAILPILLYIFLCWLQLLSVVGILTCNAMSAALITLSLTTDSRSATFYNSDFILDLPTLKVTIIFTAPFYSKSISLKCGSPLNIPNYVGSMSIKQIFAPSSTLVFSTLSTKVSILPQLAEKLSFLPVSFPVHDLSITTSKML